SLYIDQDLGDLLAEKRVVLRHLKPRRFCESCSRFALLNLLHSGFFVPYLRGLARRFRKFQEGFVRGGEGVQPDLTRTSLQWLAVHPPRSPTAPFLSLTPHTQR